MLGKFHPNCFLDILQLAGFCWHLSRCQQLPAPYKWLINHVNQPTNNRQIKTNQWLLTNFTRVLQPITSSLNWPITFNGQDLITSSTETTLHFTLKMTSAQVVETSVTNKYCNVIIVNWTVRINNQETRQVSLPPSPLLMVVFQCLLLYSSTGQDCPVWQAYKQEKEGICEYLQCLIRTPDRTDFHS